ncbi:MAG: TfoX/Sxy family protein [Pseudomonadota bacterium]
MTRLRDLPGLGPQSEKMLAKVGIVDESDLARVGPVRGFLMLRKLGLNPSLNLLYAMTGALSGQSWQETARSQRTQLLLELEGFNDLKRMFEEEAIELEI